MSERKDADDEAAPVEAVTKRLLVRAAAYVLAIAALLLVCRLKRLPLRETLGLSLPSAHDALLYSVLFIGLALIGEWMARALDVRITKWPASTLAAAVVRALTIVVVAPAAEELIFRGMLYAQIGPTPLGTLGAIVLPAVLFTAAHYNKEATAGLYLLILIDGLYFGFVRHETSSTLLTIGLHAAGNAFAFFQRIT